jgi:hypothetical protein
MNFSWELVIYRLSAQDVGRVFQTCRERRENSKRFSLWSVLLARDFPEHLKKFKPPPEVREKWYKDLYENGAYFHNKFIPLETGIPNSFCRNLLGVPILFTYRFLETDFLRHPDHKYIYIENVRDICKDDRKKMRKGTHDTCRGIDVQWPMIVIFSTELQEFSNPIKFLPFRYSSIEKHVNWLNTYFNIESIGVSVSNTQSELYCSFYFKGRLKSRHVLKDKTQKLLQTYQICGAGGGKTKTGPCKNKVLSSLVHKQPEHPNYGRCGKHPREVGDQSMYKTLEIVFFDVGESNHFCYYPGRGINVRSANLVANVQLYTILDEEKIP